MRNMNERPVCHRAEDLVTYLYGEASEAEAQDFASHMQRCDAAALKSRFNQVHESLSLRNEAWDRICRAITSPVAQTVSAGSIRSHGERCRSCSPVSLHGFAAWVARATAFAGLLLCALVVLAVSRFWMQPVEVVTNGNQTQFTQAIFDREVKKRVDEELAKQSKAAGENVQTPELASVSRPMNDRKLAGTPARSKKQRRNGLNPEERQQLAADLGLIPGREDETPFVFPDEPQQ